MQGGTAPLVEAAGGKQRGPTFKDCPWHVRKMHLTAAKGDAEGIIIEGPHQKAPTRSSKTNGYVFWGMQSIIRISDYILFQWIYIFIYKNHNLIYKCTGIACVFYLYNIIITLKVLPPAILTRQLYVHSSVTTWRHLDIDGRRPRSLRCDLATGITLISMSACACHWTVISNSYVHVNLIVYVYIFCRFQKTTEYL